MARRIIRLSDELDAALVAEAQRIPYRTISGYLREIIHAALKRAAKVTK